MDMSGERRLPASRQTVWDALNNPAILKGAIPGCEKLDATSPTEMTATAAIKVGPIAARFNGKVTLSDIDAPNGYTIAGEGQGGVAGFAKGGAKVHLEPDGEATLLRYEVNAQVGGKIAQLGARLIDATAKSMADQFFNRFTAHLTPPEAAPAEARAEAATVSAAPREAMGLPMVAWIGGVIFLAILLLLFGSLL